MPAGTHHSLQRSSLGEVHIICVTGKHHSKNAPLSVDKSAFFVGGGRGIRTPVGLLPNGFQDFLTNPTLPQNNRKYQTIENAENPVKSRAFGVLLFQKPETSDGARNSVSKTISKTFLEKTLDRFKKIWQLDSHNYIDTLVLFKPRFDFTPTQF